LEKSLLWVRLPPTYPQQSSDEIYAERYLTTNSDPAFSKWGNWIVGCTTVNLKLLCVNC
jgi:hypothetical protein